MGYDACATCCAVFSILGIIHLVLFGQMFSAHAISFEIIAVEAGWDTNEKAKSCYNAAIIYTITLCVSALARVYFRRNDAAKRAAQHEQHIRDVEGLLASRTAGATAPS